MGLELFGATRLAPPVGSNPETEATYTEHGSITSEKLENRSKSWTCNHKRIDPTTSTDLSLEHGLENRRTR